MTTMKEKKPGLYARIRALVIALAESQAKARREGLGVRTVLALLVREAKFGPRHLARKIIAYTGHGRVGRAELETARSEYRVWLDHQEASLEACTEGGLVSIIMPTCDTPASFLREAVESVRRQTYADWELCIHDDASRDAEVVRYLRLEASADRRIKISLGSSRGGIANATNAALALASGRWVAFLDHDDLLHPAALSELVERAIAMDAQIVYSDHDIVSESGERSAPFFKPDWNPDLFMAQMYLGHLVIAERALVAQLGGLRPEFDGAQDYDLLLRCAGAGARIAHVPKVLYHWRQHAGSTSSNADSKPYAHHAGRAAIQSFVSTRYPGARVDDSAFTFCYDVRFPLPAKATASLIIPTRDGLELLKACVDSVRATTQGVDYEIIVVDNGSTQPATLAWLNEQQRDHGMIVISSDTPFNWSALNNLAAAKATGDVLVFLNNDTEAVTSDWLVRLVENALREDVGTCGPLLLYGDLTIQHAGVVVGMGGWADHVFKGLAPVHHQHLFVSPILRRDVLAVTGACMAVARDRFAQLGGFDETFQVCGSDVELCLRAHRAGLLNVYVAEARLIHHESKTRDARAVPEGDFVRSAEAYHPYRTAGDPMFNPNLDLYSATPKLRAQ